MRASTRMGWLWVAVLSCPAAPSLLLAGDDYDRWYTVEVGGKRAGYLHSLQKTENGRITTDSKMVIHLDRESAAVSMMMEGEFVESADGKPISMKTIQQLGAAPTETDYTFSDKDLAVVTIAGKDRRTSTRALPEGQWLPPAASSEYIRQRLAANADKIVLRTLDPMGGPKPETLTLTGIERTTIEVSGKQVEAIKCTSASSAQAGVTSTEYMDEQGIPIKSQVGLGLFTMNVIVSDRETALAKVTQVPEIMVKTLITPDKAIRAPRDTKRAVFVLKIPDGAMPELPQTGVQQSKPIDAHSTRVNVGGTPAPAPEGDADDKDYLASTPMIRKDDPEIMKLRAEATKGLGTSKPARAEAMRAFVERYVITKDLDVGFASASEVARTRHGDCTEHGVLLAALLRADGIPSRVVSGLVYVEQEGGKGIFGYHMWAQALLEKNGKPTWVDLDGTLPGKAFDATHIALATSALDEGDEAASLAAVLPLMGRLEIKVESVE